MTLVKAKDPDSNETYYFDLDHVVVLEDVIEYVESETKQQLVYVDEFEEEIMDVVFGDMNLADIEEIVSLVEKRGNPILTNKVYAMMNGYRFYRP